MNSNEFEFKRMFKVDRRLRQGWVRGKYARARARERAGEGGEAGACARASLRACECVRVRARPGHHVGGDGEGSNERSCEGRLDVLRHLREISVVVVVVVVSAVFVCACVRACACM